MSIKTKTSQKHQNLEYQVNITFDPRDKIYVAVVPELDNCHTHGNTPEEALANSHIAIDLWLETAKAKKIPIPEPISRRKFSGKVLLRATPELHGKLAREALKKGVSMNDFIVNIIEVGLRKANKSLF
jgi:predicted RNase H-like HicB family nuclease